MPFEWKSSPQIPATPAIPSVPTNAVTYEVNLVANTVNVNGNLLYNTANVGYDIIYPSSNGGNGIVISTNTFATLNASFANITSANIGALNASFANITTANIVSLNANSANITTLYSPLIYNGVVSADPTTPLGIASKQYADAASHNVSPGVPYVPGQLERFPLAIPSGWLQAVPGNVGRTTFPNLFSAIQTYYGDGDGSTTFGLPTQYEPIQSADGIDFPRMPDAGRVHHTTELLSDGRIALLAGQNTAGATTTTYLGYINPSSNITWFASNTLPVAIEQHASTYLNDGRLLVLGGWIGTSASQQATATFGNVIGNYITWTAGTVLPEVAYQQSASTLLDGRVVQVAGISAGSTVVSTVYVGLISGTTITWGTGNNYPIAVFDQQQVTLADGRLLVSGGSPSGTSTVNNVYFGTVLSSPSNTISWVAGTNLPEPLHGHTMKILNDGRIFVAGGANVAVSTVNTYIGTISGTTISWVQGTDLPIALQFSSMNITSDGSIWLFGGSSSINGTVRVYQGTINGNIIAWRPLELNLSTMTPLSDGRILMIGGSIGTGGTARCFFGNVTSNTIVWSSAPAAPVNIFAHSTTLLSDGRVVIVGGANESSVVTSNVWFGNISGNSIVWTTGTAILGGPIGYHKTVLCTDGRLLVMGGYNGSAGRTDTYFGNISGTTITWTAGTFLPNARYHTAASLLTDGRVLLTGGHDGISPRSQTYFGIISGSTITWSLGTYMVQITYAHSQFTLPDGRIFISGGGDGVTVRANTLLGIITGGTNMIRWADSPPLQLGLYTHASCYTSNGMLLTFGGLDGPTCRGDVYVGKILLVGVKT